MAKYSGVQHRTSEHSVVADGSCHSVRTIQRGSMRAAYTPCNILLIDDDPSALDAIQALLAESKPAIDAPAKLFRLMHVERLSLGLETLRQITNQVVLLDLNLPDSQGIETLKRLRHNHPLTPTIVLTGMNDDVVAVQAIEAGAQGFLSKDNLDPNLLAYALLLALDRQRQLQVPLSPEKAVERKVRRESANGAMETEPPSPSEIENFERLAYSVRPATVTSGLFESGLLKETVPDIFAGLVETYIQILDEVLEQKTFRVKHPISNHLRSLAEQLGFLKGGPRDVVELHTFALKQKSETENVMRTKVYAAEGRLIVLELMGYLATYYRKYFIGLSKINAARAANRPENQPENQPESQPGNQRGNRPGSRPVEQTQS